MRGLICLCGLALVGCATIIDGNTETITIDSEPQGITVMVDGSEYKTPAKVELARDTEHYAQFPNGQRVNITGSFNGWFIANLALGGIPGMIVDLITGAAGGNLEPDGLLFKDGKVYNADNKNLITEGDVEVKPKPKARSNKHPLASR